MNEQKYVAIIRPRRFGKTVMANMIAAYFGKGVDSSDAFRHLNVSKYDWYEMHLNKHNVIHMTFSKLPRGCRSYVDYIYHQDFATDQDKAEFTIFLSNLLKDNAYVEMAYMTGILPIAKYSSGSELNMFCEYTMAAEERYSEFGRTGIDHKAGLPAGA